jgi:hypothetical protein
MHFIPAEFNLDDFAAMNQYKMEADKPVFGRFCP